MTAKPKSMGIGCLMIAVIIWNGIVLGFDGLLVWKFVQQHYAQSDYIPADATVTNSFVKRTESSGGSGGRGSSVNYSPIIEYEYTVNNQAYTSDRYSFVVWGRGTPDYARSLVNKFPFNSAITIYYDPSDPSKAVIDQSFSEFPTVVAMLLLPFHCVALIGIYYFRHMWRYKDHQGDDRWFAPYIVSKTESKLVLRDHAYPTWFVFLATLGVSSFIMTWVLLFIGGGFNAPYTTVLLALAICLLAAGYKLFKSTKERHSPNHQLIIDYQSNSLTRGDQTLDMGLIKSIAVRSETKSKNNREAWNTHTARARLHDGTWFDLLIARGHKDHARVFKRCIKKELGI